MKNKGQVRWRLPGWVGRVVMVLFTNFWAFWGINELFHEGWWGAWYNRLPYLVPLVVTLIPTWLAVVWPLAGGLLIIVFGVVFVFLFGLDNPLLGGVMILFGVLFLLDARFKRTHPPQTGTDLSWWRRHFWRLLVFAPPAMIVLVFSAANLPRVLTRVDDGEREARLIEGNGVVLVWAPQGPGWNWRQPWGGYPSWQALALYGLEPPGLGEKTGYGEVNGNYVFAMQTEMDAYQLCRYLSADGLTLMDAPQEIWRLPTTDELVRSLVRSGYNAGCTWDGAYRQWLDCQVRPDKESPLWASEHPSIYYWTADEFNERQGTFVSYNGMVSATLKTGGNPRHGYRCVRDP